MSEIHKIDARGSFCPGPLMELIAALKRAAVGEELEILSSDNGSAVDIPEWVSKAGHNMVRRTQHDGYWSIVVRKAK